MLCDRGALACAVLNFAIGAFVHFCSRHYPKVMPRQDSGPRLQKIIVVPCVSCSSQSRVQVQSVADAAALMAQRRPWVLRGCADGPGPDLVPDWRHLPRSCAREGAEMSSTNACVLTGACRCKQGQRDFAETELGESRTRVMRWTRSASGTRPWRLGMLDMV